MSVNKKGFSLFIAKKSALAVLSRASATHSNPSLSPPNHGQMPLPSSLPAMIMANSLLIGGTRSCAYSGISRLFIFPKTHGNHFFLQYFFSWPYPREPTATKTLRPTFSAHSGLPANAQRKIIPPIPVATKLIRCTSERRFKKSFKAATVRTISKRNIGYANTIVS